MEVTEMSKNRANNRGQRTEGVNPQGYAESGPTPQPKSTLENAAKKSNQA